MSSTTGLCACVWPGPLGRLPFTGTELRKGGWEPDRCVETLGAFRLLSHSVLSTLLWLGGSCPVSTQIEDGGFGATCPSLSAS